MEQLEVLVVLDGDLDAQRLVATWPNVVEHQEPEQTYAAWSAVSGVDIDDVTKLAPVLFRNGICGPEGFVDEDARRFIRQRILKALPKAAPR